MTFSIPNNYMSDESSKDNEVFFTMMSSAPDSRLALLFQAISIRYQSDQDESTSVTSQQAMPFDSHWSNAVSSFEAGTADPQDYFASPGDYPSQSDIDDGGYYYDMNGYFQAEYKLQHWLDDQYGVNGYNSTGPFQARKFYTGGGEYCAQFSRTVPGGSTP